tara:strand:+ start:758 stop:1705 length:948 start_codon:yes stop_codon:yes gene_type:complete
MMIKQNFKNPIILLNGISRSGKAITWYVVSSIENVDVPLNEPFPDWIMDAYNSDDISEKAVVTLLGNYFRIYSWYSFLGRGINLKEADQSSFLKLSSLKELEIRNTRHDNSKSWQEFSNLWSSGDFYPCFTTDLSGEIKNELINQGFNFININTLRNPKRVFLEWCNTGRGSRYDKLDRMGKYYFNYKGMNIPGFAHKYKEKWFESSPEERCYMVVSQYYEDFFSHDHSQNVNIFFEDVIQDPLPEIMKVANFLNLKIKDNYKEMFKLMDVPRFFDQENYIKDDNGYFTRIQKSSYEHLCSIEEKYEVFKSEFSK